MTKKRDTEVRADRTPDPKPDGNGPNFSHLGEDIRRALIGLAVCGGVLVLLKLYGM